MRSDDAAKREHRIRDKAFESWNHAGCPAGKDEEFWAKGRELVDKEDREEEEAKRRRDEAADRQAGRQEGPGGRGQREDARGAPADQRR